MPLMESNDSVVKRAGNTEANARSRNKKVRAKEREEQSNHQRTTRALRKSSLSKAKEKAKERAMAKAKSKAKAKVINQGILALLNLLAFPKALRTLPTLHQMAKRNDPCASIIW